MRECANQKSAKLSRHMERLCQPHRIYMSINKSIIKISEINHNNYMTRPVCSKSFQDSAREKFHLRVSDAWNKRKKKRNVLASQEVFCMKAPRLKRIQNWTNICSWMWCTLFGSLLCHLQSGAQLCLIKCVCISHQFLAKLQPSEREKTWRR